MKKWALLLTGFLAISAMVQAQSSNELETLKTEKFEISFPKSWELDQSGQMNTQFILFSPLSSSEDDFKENVNLLVQDISAYNLDLEQLINVTLEQIKTMLDNGVVISNTLETGKEIPYQKLIYTAKQGEFDLKFEQYIWVIDSKAYILTLTCKTTEFDAYKAIGERILNSFTILQ